MHKLKYESDIKMWILMRHAVSSPFHVSATFVHVLLLVTAASVSDGTTPTGDMPEVEWRLPVCASGLHYYMAHH